MNHVVLIGHGRLAHEMKNSAEMIFGELSNFTSIEFLKEEGLDSLKTKIFNAVQNVPDPTLIFADLFCGTPYNASCAVAMEHTEYNIEVVSGMSLPLVLEIAAMSQTSKLEKIVEHILQIPQDTVKSFCLQNIVEEEEL